MSFLPDFRIECYFSRWEFAVRHVLGASDAQSMSLSELLELADPEDRAAWEKLSLGYIETFGTPRLREVVADTYDSVASDDILCFSGAEEGIFVAMHTLLDADSHAIVVTPCYQSAETVPRSICRTTGIALNPDDGWALDLDAVGDAIEVNTRLIYINFPHNPTGKIIDRESYLALLDLARERGIYVFSDEVYRMLEREPAQRLPNAVDCYERALSLNVTSKAYGFAGLRVGWIACKDRELLQRMERAKHYLSICNSAPGEALAVMVLKAGETILARNREITERNLRELDDFFAEYPQLFQWYRPDGACIGYPRYLGTEGVESLTERLLRDAGVMVVPAPIFGSELTPTPPNHFRIGFGRADFSEGLAAFREVVDKGA